LAASKRAMWRMLQLGLDEGCERAASDIVSMWSHPDANEGAAAFMQRREPAWQLLTDRSH
ncbi:MAG TPA: hypothetical protein VFV02_04775, partial [Acidimicrobiales bacterium]|nr:hypothetical protein [Acidimicrobiales bacterium]